MLFSIRAPVTAPVFLSTVASTMPLPVIPRARHSSGYTGTGALIALCALAEERHARVRTAANASVRVIRSNETKLSRAAENECREQEE